LYFFVPNFLHLRHREMTTGFLVCLLMIQRLFWLGSDIIAALQHISCMSLFWVFFCSRNGSCDFCFTIALFELIWADWGLPIVSSFEQLFLLHFFLVGHSFIQNSESFCAHTAPLGQSRSTFS
jgi:hypothetical protein